MPTKRITDPLLPGKIYHVYNRGNEKTRIFFTDANYKHFINRYKYYLDEYIQTYAFCLIPNHFHLLIEIKDLHQPDGHQIVSQQFRKFFCAYAMAINNQEKRRGSLFQKPFRRQVINTNWQLKRVVYYIHNNPSKHHLTNEYKSFQYSSYRQIVSQKEGFVDFRTVLSWFHDLEEFVEYHDYLREH